MNEEYNKILANEIINTIYKAKETYVILYKINKVFINIIDQISKKN